MIRDSSTVPPSSVQKSRKIGKWLQPTLRNIQKTEGLSCTAAEACLSCKLQSQWRNQNQTQRIDDGRSENNSTPSVSHWRTYTDCDYIKENMSPSEWHLLATAEATSWRPEIYKDLSKMETIVTEWLKGQDTEWNKQKHNKVRPTIRWPNCDGGLCWKFAG